MAFCKNISLNLYVFEYRNPGFGWRALTIWFAECHSVKMVICNPLRIPRFKEIGRSVVHLSYFLYLLWSMVVCLAIGFVIGPHVQEEEELKIFTVQV